MEPGDWTELESYVNAYLSVVRVRKNAQAEKLEFERAMRVELEVLDDIVTARRARLENAMQLADGTVAPDLRDWIAAAEAERAEIQEAIDDGSYTWVIGRIHDKRRAAQRLTTAVPLAEAVSVHRSTETHAVTTS